VDRLIALVGLRLTLELRGLVGRQERAFGLLLVVPGLLLGTIFTSGLVYFGVRALARAEPGLLLSGLSAAATAVGLVWALSPLLTGLALTETHDLTRLLGFPVPFRTLLVSSLLANLLEPAALAKLPVILAFCAALGGPPVGLPIVLACGVLTLVLMLAVTQTAALVLQALSRNRRAHDRALFAGIALGFLVSLLPFLFIWGGRPVRGALSAVLALDLFAASPWAWSVRGAVYASRGELIPALGFAAAGAMALAGVVGLNAVVARRLYEGSLDLGRARGAGARGRRFSLPGAVGALFEKDLLLYWRDPRFKAMVLTSLLSPVVLLVIWRSASGQPPTSFLFLLAALSGLGTLGGNAFALERRGLLLLFGFPVDRFAVLLGKNLAAMALRVPSLAALVTVLAFAAPGLMVFPLAATALIAMLMGAATDNVLSILYPVPVPEPGRNPYAAVSGSRGLVAAAVTALLLSVAAALAVPFWFLAFLPVWLERGRLLLLTVPLALVGASAVYLLAVGVASWLLARREPELLARVLAEE
jgi:ABC-2 type transport system permease protein